MDEREVFDWPYPSPFVGLVTGSAIFIAGGYFVSYMLVWLGILLVLVGVGMIVLGFTAETRYRIVCMTGGFTVEKKRRLGRTHRTTYSWHEVCETGYREVRRDMYFAAYTDYGRAFEVRRITKSPFIRSKSDALIETFNARTFLPYIWQRRGPGSSRLWRYGFYQYGKVPRGTTIAAHISTGISSATIDEQ